MLRLHLVNLEVFFGAISGEKAKRRRDRACLSQNCRNAWVVRVLFPSTSWIFYKICRYFASVICHKLLELFKSSHHRL